MARMIPPECPPETESKAEKALFVKFRDFLDDTCTVFHSFKRLASRKSGAGHKEIEADFLVFCPRRGFLIVDAKGGIIRYEGKRAQWTQNGKPMKSPFAQASRNFHELSGYLEECLGISSLPFPMGYGVAFPDVAVKPRAVPAEALPEITLLKDDCNCIDHAVDGLFAHYSDPEGIPDRAALGRAIKILTQDFEYTARHSDQLDVIRKSIKRLTEEQCRLLEFLSGHREAIIDGCAGSGKTIMALKKARQIAGAGQKVLLLCFNELLGAHLGKIIRSEKSEAFRNNITCATFHGFCQEVLKKSGRRIAFRQSDPDFWDHALPLEALACLDENPRKFDAIIVDEAQDFREDFWVVVQELRSPEGYFYAFRDQRQNVFSRTRRDEIPISTPPYSLNCNLRNTRHIGSFVKRLGSREMRTHERAPEGVPVIRHNCATDAEVRQRVEAALNDLMVTHRLNSSQVVILGARSMKNTSLGKDGLLGQYRVSENGTVSGAHTVPYYTYMKFKGMESDAVIVVDVDPSRTRWQSRRGLYTAASRAVWVLVVVYRAG